MKTSNTDSVFFVRILMDSNGEFVFNENFIVTLTTMRENEDPFEFEYALLDIESRLNSMELHESFLFNHERGNPKSLAQVTKLL